MAKKNSTNGRVAKITTMAQWFEKHNTGTIIDACLAYLSQVIAEPRSRTEADEMVITRLIIASRPDLLAHSFETAHRGLAGYHRKVLSALGAESQPGEGAQITEIRAGILAASAAYDKLERLITGFKPAPYKPPDLVARMSDSEPVFTELLRRARQDHHALRQSVKRDPDKIAQGKRAARLYGAVIESLAALPAALAAFCPSKLGKLEDVLKLADAIGRPIFAPLHCREPLEQIGFISGLCSKSGTADTALIEFCRPRTSGPDRGYPLPASGIRNAMERASTLTQAIVRARALAHRLARLREDPSWVEDYGATWCRVGTWLENQII